MLVMRSDDREWWRALIKARMDRHRVKEEMTQDMLRRSREALVLSEKLLRQPVPAAWHPDELKSEANNSQT